MRTRTAFLVVALLSTAMAFLSNACASFDLTLTFDVSKLTYAWTGAATSPQFTVPGGGWSLLSVIGQPHAGGLGAVVMPGGSTVAVTQFNSFFINRSNWWPDHLAPNVLDMAPPGVMPSIYATAAYFDSTQAESTYVQITGNGSEVSYASANPFVLGQILNMGGVPLYFRHHWYDPGAGSSPQVDVFPTQIGTINVIPEPSTYALLLMTGVGTLLWVRRRR